MESNEWIDTFSEPKTRYSRRVIPLSPKTMQALREHRSRLVTAGLPVIWQGLVFPNDKGGPMTERHINTLLNRNLQRAGIDRHFKVHWLRDTCATLMNKQGTNARKIQQILGHHDYAFTVNTYVGLDDPEDIRDDLNKMDNLATMTG